MKIYLQTTSGFVPFENTMYISDKKSYSVRDFIKRYHDKFPILIQVTQGYMGSCEKDTVGTGQIMRFHSIKSIRCVCGKITSCHGGHVTNISSLNFPLAGSKDMFVKTYKGKIKSIAEIAQKGKFPCKVNLVDEYYLHQSDGISKLNESVPILFEGETILQCIMGNPVSGVELLNHVVSIPEFQQEIRVAVVLGIDGFDTNQWNNFQAYMSEVVCKYIDFNQYAPIEGIVSIMHGSDKIDKKQQYERLHFSPKEEELGERYYDPITKDKKPATPEEPVYAVIPDQTYEYLAVQSLEWKRQLNTDLKATLSKQPCDDQKEISEEIVPPLPRRNSTNKIAGPKTFPKPVNHPNQKKTDSSSFIPEFRTKLKEMSPNNTLKDDQETEDDNSLEKLTIADIGSVLRRLRLNRYVDTFEESMVDGTLLKEFNDEILQEFGFTKMECIRLMKFIQKGHVPK